MITVIDKERCYGCEACRQVCPKQGISMKEDEEGFLYPFVDQTSCIDCGACENICISNQKGKKDSGVKAAYIAFSKDEAIRMNSSSGGAFSILASSVLQTGGLVFGAVFDENNTVHHIGIRNEEDLSLLRGSKYLQSRIEDTYCETKDALDNGRFVLFSGTGCQIAGLMSFLKKDYPNLLLVDVVCHGVPSPKVWLRYLSELESRFGGKTNHIEFRNKKNGWSKYSLLLSFSSQRQYTKGFYEDGFMQLFLKNISLRPSCYSCEYKPNHSLADITLGDCWTISEIKPDFNDDKGVSIVYTHTEKGQLWLRKVYDQLMIEEVEAEKADQPMFRESASVNPLRTVFYDRLAKGETFSQLVKLIEPTIIERIGKKARRAIGKLKKLVHIK